MTHRGGGGVFEVAGWDWTCSATIWCHDAGVKRNRDQETKVMATFLYWIWTAACSPLHPPAIQLNPHSEKRPGTSRLGTPHCPRLTATGSGAMAQPAVRPKQGAEANPSSVQHK
ncbi:hypothetical protein SKAU_G00033510 [Synaphobranchus kaupii]|uniref:Uncharacterized protein n=1 Tax=Synaphobranchus kaupii TaxID=118154 RepID=A0A9Q1JEG0_SYNKA|nr:hypothetical protein SKAU_G00033510 [Synaphobranchus kaupii]